MKRRTEIESALDALGTDGEGLDVIHLHAPEWLRQLLDEIESRDLDLAEARRDVERLAKEVEARPEISVEDAEAAACAECGGAGRRHCGDSTCGSDSCERCPCVTSGAHHEAGTR